ncbi:MAG: hypothetical protein WKF76_07860 [Nocardioidaceae bacterium]
MLFRVALIGGLLAVVCSIRSVVGSRLAIRERCCTLAGMRADVGEPRPVLLRLDPVALGLPAILPGPRAVVSRGSTLDLAVHEDIKVGCHIAVISVGIAAVGADIASVSLGDDAFEIPVAVAVRRVARCCQPVPCVSNAVTFERGRVTVVSN